MPSEIQKWLSQKFGESKPPPGWSYNPSAPLERAPIVALAILGLGLSDPGRLTGREILLPTALALTAAFGVLGSSRRWEKKPWLVSSFGLAAGPLVFTGATVQLVRMAAENDWQTKPVLKIAAAMITIGPAMDEVLASLQHVRSSWLQGRSGWRAFFGLTPKRRTVRVLEGPL